MHGRDDTRCYSRSSYLIECIKRVEEHKMKVRVEREDSHLTSRPNGRNGFVTFLSDYNDMIHFLTLIGISGNILDLKGTFSQILSIFWVFVAYKESFSLCL